MNNSFHLSCRTPFPVLASLCCLIGSVVLCSLGVWQVQRLSWKTELQHHLDMMMEQSDLPRLSSSDFQNSDGGEIKRGDVALALYPSKALYLNGYVENSKTSFPVVIPAKFSEEDVYVAVIAWVDDVKNPEKWRGASDYSADLTGLVRRPDFSIFKPKNAAQKGEWWRLDYSEMSDFWGLSPVVPRIFYAENAAPIIDGLRPYRVETHLRNEHLQYAIFWFVMAGLLIVMWGLRFLRPYLQSA
ncbi:MAG: SURF1 family protein [Alphaproteobacteria bacterium]|nr:SURF1 family protein [Alphaproteobacteria bacterium]MCB9985496.1 SURF1 family protein [Micavibrio sp.]HPQ50196.1 SURF1 family protein [Alphaproteobacteria bacterium]